MVGTPKSTGCQTCRRRKKKCDQRLPACSQCERTGWPCPGYGKQWKFVDETKQLARRYRKNDHDGPGLDTVRDQDQSCSLGCRPSFSASSSPSTDDSRFQIYELAKRGNATSYLGIYWPLSSESDRHVSLFISIVTNEVAQDLLPLQTVGSFLSSIPARLGRNAALDAVVASLCSIYVDYLTTGSTGSNATLKKYINSLNALQTCVQDPEMRTQSETICASILIQTCELMIVNDNGQWNNLSRGCQLLFRDCEPSRFVSGFDRDMLESQQTLFIAQDMHAGEDSFLAQPEWREVLRYPSERPSYSSEAARLKAELCVFLVDIPGMIRESTDLVISYPAKRGRADHRSRLQDVVSRILRMKQHLEAWSATLHVKAGWHTADHESLGEGQEADDGRLEADEQPYPNVLIAVLDCIVNSVLVKLDRMLLCLSNLLHQAVHGTDSPVHRHSLQKMERRQANSRMSFVLIESSCKIVSKPLGFGLKMIASNDDLFEVSRTSGQG